MRYLLFTLLFIYFISCNYGKNINPVAQNKPVDTIVKHDTVFVERTDWQEGFGLTHEPEKDSIWGKPVQFYITQKNCSPIAIDFYFGDFRPADNRTTVALLALAATDDDVLRPFYRWCLNKTIQIQDGALADHTGVPARRYAEKFPKEFFEYMDIDTTNEKYKEWVEAINYSGFYNNEDWEKLQGTRNKMTNAMKKNCTDCNEQLLQRINKFVMDCFPRNK